MNKRRNDRDNDTCADRKSLTVGRAAILIVTMLLMLTAWGLQRYVSTTEAAIASKVEQKLYDADKRAQEAINRQMLQGQADLINLHLYPERTKEKMIRERAYKEVEP